ncbi:hypothetical protein HTZ97_16360 [Desulfuromonas acetoxidans]|uniref:hypothetical protein n=1 Tax=Desulfuromonas acetoxidans TaxID=891 RepID=UPI0002D67227|nr:hypothetical protein [Desulfuromonas acetoxidans]MBF0646881.1 hypothetical protein [Desulfuromonas acetoxidans]NVD26158.1 hypothetical protein [Desulfuromonas acetoxidans]NVE18030.1 hypothetical protein [Desulfuromonas acetoxidans]
MAKKATKKVVTRSITPNKGGVMRVIDQSGEKDSVAVRPAKPTERAAEKTTAKTTAATQKGAK